MAQREIPLMREFLARYRHPLVRLFRRNILDKTVQDIHTGRVHQVKAALKGQADVYGFRKTCQRVYSASGVVIGATNGLGPAVPFEIEFKGERTPVSEEQKRWRAFCEDWGIPHLVLRARVGEEQEVTLLRWIDELNKLVDSL